MKLTRPRASQPQKAELHRRQQTSRTVVATATALYFAIPGGRASSTSFCTCCGRRRWMCPLHKKTLRLTCGTGTSAVCSHDALVDASPPAGLASRAPRPPPRCVRMDTVGASSRRQSGTAPSTPREDKHSLTMAATWSTCNCGISVFLGLLDERRSRDLSLHHNRHLPCSLGEDLGFSAGCCLARSNTEVSSSPASGRSRRPAGMGFNVDPLFFAGRRRRPACVARQTQK